MAVIKRGINEVAVRWSFTVTSYILPGNCISSSQMFISRVTVEGIWCTRGNPSV
jgi:hypothetical protein